MKLSIGIFGRTRRPEIKALGDGVAASGDRPIFQNPDAWKQVEATSDRFDAIVVHGFSHKGQSIADCYRAWGTPVFVIEQGHIKRGEYFQLGVEDINWLPDEADSDRREALGLECPTERGGNPDGYVLVLGQKPGDAQHPFADFNEWAEPTLETLAEIDVVYRKHPLDVCKWPKGDYVSHDPKDISLEESMAGASCVMTYNSNAGLKAALAGVPTYCDASAHYADACTLYYREEWEQAINRICYAQWTPDELATGEPWKYIKEKAGINERITVNV